MASLICGSIAYDTIMNFEGKFADQILPEQIHILNVAFLVPTMRREFGGCAGNIAYNLHLLGGDPIIMATVGGDANPYMDHLNQLKIDSSHIRQIDNAFTAQAMITTDQTNNQITAFHPGAMSESHLNQVASVVAERNKNAKGAAKFGIVAPDGRQGMWEHCHQLADANIPFIFDPGQGLPMFDGTDLMRFIDQATWVTVNDYEGKMLSDRTGLSHADISRRVQGLIVTLGAEGCEVWVDGEKTLVPPVKPSAVVDPTGCGDAWRGALLFGLEQGWSLAKCAALGNQVGALKIAQRGPQNYNVDGLTIA